MKNIKIENYGYTGKLVERELVGEVNKKGYLKEMEEASKEGKVKKHGGREFFGGSAHEQTINNSFVDGEDATDLVKRSQPWEDPCEPEKRFADDLHATIAERVAKDDYRRLKFYTAVDSHLDKKGIDCFFEFDYFGKKIRISIDITTDPQKERSALVDLVFLVPKSGLDPAVNKKEYFEYINKFADEVVEEINYKTGPAYLAEDYFPRFH